MKKISKKGFTLIELVVVMAIIAILAVIIVGAILAARTAATNTQRTGTVRTIETALEARAARCSGLYYKPGTPAAACGAIDMTNVGTIKSALSNTTPKYLTQDLVIDDDTKFTVATSGTNNYVITALDNSNPANTLYTATR